ncbi:MAG: chain length-determining protein [Burkholderiales bacterium]|uniref:XrtA system polysaccharide chain length determinant n=1 Tax=Inhella sp. TaxID=1921806 RepID=UPI001AD34119|nr:chain length-determining protein [Burkholderiales bacterium]
MEALIAELLGQARRIWKYRWLGLIAAWVVGLVGMAVSFALPNQFAAQARIYVDTQSILKPLMSGLAVQPNVDEQVKMLSRTLISRPNIEKLVRMADLDLKKQSKAEQEALIDSLMRKLSIATTGKDNLYTLSYQDPDSETAKRVVQSLVSIFVESSLGASRKDTATATTFINEQIKTYEAKLEEAETRLKEFRLRNLETMQGDGKDSATRIAEMHAQLERSKLELREAENARDAAKQQLDMERRRQTDTSSTSLLPEATQTFATPELDARINDLRRNLDGLLQRFTDLHPDVVALRKLIRDLEEQKKREVAEMRKAAATGAPMAAPEGSMQQELHRMIATAEVQVAALRARVNEYQGRYGAALTSMRTAPQLEAEAAQLNRDYEIHKKNYADLVARRESAAMSGELDVASGVADFRLIEPPRVSPKPVAPNRFLLLGAALVLALGSGLFTSFAASQLRPVFYNSNELRTKTELPVLGVVSRMSGDADRRRSRNDRLRVVGATGGLVIAYLIAMSALAIINARQLG